MQCQRFFAIALLALTVMPHALAQTRTFYGTGTSSATGSSLSAEVAFDLLMTGDLQVTLKNTSQEDLLHNPDVLTAVFFDSAACGGPCPSSPSLTPGSAKVMPGSTVLHAPAGFPTGTGADGSIGGEWGFKQQSGRLGSGLSQQYGISSVGFGVFGPSNRFDTSQNLHGQTGLQGLNYGITTAADDPNTGFGLVGAGGYPLVKNGVVFTFTGLPSCFELSDISTIRFQYGTSLTEPCLVGTEELCPEPGTMALLGLGIAPIIAKARRRRRQQEPAAEVDAA